jgi:Ca2+:H+ antiporter
LSDLLATARQEAQRLKHDYVGTEHLLLALLSQGEPALTTILNAFSVDPAALRDRLEKRSPQGRGAPEDPEALNLRSGAKRVLDQARAGINGAEPGPTQVLTALLSDGKGVVAASLGDLGVPVAKVREALGPAPEAALPAVERLERRDKPERMERAERQRGERREGRAERAPKGGRREEAPARDRREGSEARRDTPGREQSAPAAGRPPRIAPVQDPLLTWRKLPLLALPASIYLAYTGGAPLLVFGVACLATIPLAGYMGEATEHLAARTGPTFGGFLNATFGNAAELIIALTALRAGMVDLVKASIIGSILGNLLLILGLSLVAGGLKRPFVKFSRTTAGMSAGMLALAVTGLIFPTLFHSLHPGGPGAVELHLSEAVAVVLILTYLLSLVFSLKTHRPVLGGEAHPAEGPLWSVPAAIGVLALATVGVAVESEILVHAVSQLTAGSSLLSAGFLGLIVIPIIGNAAEHATAIVVARKGKVDLALQIAMGSSAQVALLIAPLLVFAGAAFGIGTGGESMTLVFRPFEVAAMGLATLLASIVTLDGESHWFEGVQLLALYAMVAIAVFFMA